MHEIAEYGIAAHALYKDGEGGDGGELLSKESSAYSWLRRTIQALSEGDNPEEFLEHTKLELFQDQVFRSEEHTSELQSLMRISYAVFCLKNKKPRDKLHLNHNNSET